MATWKCTAWMNHLWFPPHWAIAVRSTQWMMEEHTDQARLGAVACVMWTDESGWTLGMWPALLYQSPAEATHMFHSAQLLQNMPSVCLMQTCTQNLKDSGSLSRHNHLSHESTAWPYHVESNLSECYIYTSNKTSKKGKKRKTQ